jgi:hypothetical protein
MGILKGNLTIERIISFILNFNLDCKGVRVYMIDNTPKKKKHKPKREPEHSV